MIEDLAELECKKFRQDDDEVAAMILVGKIQIIQFELTLLAVTELSEKLTRLFGL